MSSQLSSRTSFLERMRKGDQNAWDLLCDTFSRVVYSKCRRKGVSQDDAAEITQEVFLAVWKGIDGFEKRGGDSFVRWLHTILNSKITDVFRNEKRQPKAAGGSSANERIQAAPDSLDDSISVDDLKKAMYQKALELIQERFEENRWKAFWETEIEGHPTDVVAAQLGVKPGAIRQSRSQVRKFLIEQLGEMIGFEPETE